MSLELSVWKLANKCPASWEATEPTALPIKSIIEEPSTISNLLIELRLFAGALNKSNKTTAVSCVAKFPGSIDSATAIVKKPNS